MRKKAVGVDLKEMRKNTKSCFPARDLYPGLPDYKSSRTAAHLTAMFRSFAVLVILFSSSIRMMFFFMARQPLVGLGLLITLKHTICGRTPLDEWSTRRRDLFLKTHNIHSRQTCMSRVGYEPPVPASERLQTYALDSAATGIGRKMG